MVAAPASFRGLTIGQVVRRVTMVGRVRWLDRYDGWTGTMVGLVYVRVARRS
jgi:hypothetical protein